MDISFRLDLFATAADKEYSEECILYALEALVNCDREWLRRHPETPPLYMAGVKYMREPVGREEFCGIPQVLKQGGGDCDDLASWRVAEYRNAGYRCRPFIKWRRNPARKFTLYHVVVQFPDGRIEDPSKVLGMGPNSEEYDS